jgi:DNA-binding CsgD family transcriptional regulator
VLARALAVEESRCSVALLESQPPGRELAMAYSNAAQLSMLADDRRAAAATGGRAIELAERLGETEILVHALNNLGAAEMSEGSPGGVEKLERSLALALDAGLEEHVARAYTNLGSAAVRICSYALADRNLSAGIAYCEEHDLESWRLYMIGWDARSGLDQGRWDEAAERAETVLRHPNVAVPSRITPLVVLGRVRARRGDGDPWALLDEALALALGTGELQRLAPVAAARAETRWLQGAGIVAAETDAALALARDRGDIWAVGELWTWRRRAGIEDVVALDAVAAPFARELDGDWSGAAGRWEQLGCPYEAALVRAQSEDEASLRLALGAFQGLGAVPAARAAAQRLRDLGATSIGRGPHRSTVQNPGQLTARQLEILLLLGDRLTNTQIAARLYISPKTVDHHVSAILAKLGVHSRTQAAAEAVRLGLAEK